MNCCTSPRLVRALCLIAGLTGAAFLVGTCDGKDAPAATPAPTPAVQDDDGAAGHAPGRWNKPNHGAQREDLDPLNAIGYAQGTTLAPEQSGVTRHDRARAYQGTNFYTSGHAASACLMDMDGKVLHTWHADLTSVWPGELPPGRALPPTWSFWRRAFLLDDGSVLAIFEGHSLVKLDKDSNVVWKQRCRAHHDLDFLPNGDIAVLTRTPHVVSGLVTDEPVLEDFVTVFASDGTEKSRFSLLEALRTAGPGFESLWQAARERRRDVFHTNSLALLDGRFAETQPAFAAGNLLVSSRTLDFVGVVDPARHVFVWKLTGAFRGQHDPKLVDDGHLLLFDNLGRGERSTVLELDPATGATAWQYGGSDAQPLYSKFCGAAARLPNGNTLITESENGRALEVTPAGEIVWEFWNPERAGEQREYIATLFEVVRLGPEQPLAWLQ